MKLLISFLMLLNVSQAADPIKFRISHLVEAAEIKYEIPTGILEAMIIVESAGNHKAYVPVDGKSHKASFGLLQIQYASARVVGFRGRASELMKPEVNIEYAAAYLRWLIDQSDGDISLALTGYNAGPNSKIFKNKRYSRYVGLVLNTMVKSQ